MATVLDVQAGFQGSGAKPQWGVDSVTGALVPNPLNSGTVDIGAADAKVGTIYTANGFPTGTTLLASAKGATMVPFYTEEEITLSTTGTTSDSTANLLPANSLIVAVMGRVTTTITAAATGWSLGTAATADRFTANNTNLTAGTTDVSVTQWDQSKAAGYTPWQAAAAKIRITSAGGNAGAGKVRVCVMGFTFTAPTS